MAGEVVAHREFTKVDPPLEQQSGYYNIHGPSHLTQATGERFIDKGIDWLTRQRLNEAGVVQQDDFDSVARIINAISSGVLDNFSFPYRRVAEGIRQSRHAFAQFDRQTEGVFLDQFETTMLEHFRSAAEERAQVVNAAIPALVMEPWAVIGELDSRGQIIYSGDHWLARVVGVEPELTGFTPDEATGQIDPKVHFVPVVEDLIGERAAVTFPYDVDTIMVKFPNRHPIK